MALDPRLADLVASIPQQSREKLDRILGGIAADTAVGPSGGRRTQLQLNDAPVSPWMTLFILTAVVGCRDLGRAEKIRYEIPLTWKGRAVSLTFEKFGPRAYIDPTGLSEGEVLAEVDQLFIRLRGAVPIVEKYVLGPFAADQLTAGRVTIDNQFFSFRDRFEHFRRRAEQGDADAAALTGKARRDSPAGRHTDGASIINERTELRRHAHYDADAAVVSFFSLLEHVLIFGLACANYDPATDDLAVFVGVDWATKFRRVVDITNPDAKRIYDSLRQLADRVRNPSAHGGFDRELSRFHFHLPGIGAVPSQLSRADDDPILPVWWLDTPSRGETVWPVVDEALDWLESGPLRFAWALADSGLSQSYSADSLELLRRAIEQDSEQDGSFHEYLRHQSYIDDQHTNMDY